MKRAFWPLAALVLLLGRFGQARAGYVTLDPPGAIFSAAYGINGNNIVGDYVTSGNHIHGYVYDGTSYTTLDDPLGAKGTVAKGISGNNIVGYYFDSSSHEHGFLYNGASYTTLDVPSATYTAALEPLTK